MQFRVDTDGMTFIVGGIRGVMDLGLPRVQLTPDL